MTTNKDLENLESAILAGNLEEVDWITRTQSDKPDASYFILKKAISSGQIEAAKLLVKRGYPVSENSHYEENELLHIAATTGDLQLIQLMLERTISTTTLDKDGLPPIFKLVHLSSGCVVNYSKFLNCFFSKDKNNSVHNKYQARSFNLLHYAAERGNARIIPSLVENCCELNERSNDGSTALHIAAKNRHSHVVQTLLEHGAKDFIVDNENLYPLYFTVMNGDFKTFQILMNHNLRSTTKKLCFLSKENLSLIYLATSLGNSRIVESLVENGAALNYYLPETKQSALHLAVMNEDIQIVDLLKHEISMAEPDIIGYTPLHLACIKGNLPIVSTLLETDLYNVNAKSTLGLTPLHLASSNDNTEVVSLLLEKGADCMALDENERTPLPYAFKNASNDVETLIILLKHNRRTENDESSNSSLLPEDYLIIQYQTEAKEDINKNSALHLAVEREDEEVIRLLLKYQACVDVWNKNGHTPLDLATINGSLSIVNIFLQSRPNLRTLFKGRSGDGFTPMHFAVEEGNTDMLEVFFESGISADLSCKNDNPSNAFKHTGLSPLHVAVQKSDTKLISLLLKNGAKVDVPGRTNFETPLFVAAEIGNTEVLEILAEASTIRSSEWNEGYLPLYIATYRGHEEFVKKLLDKGVNPNANLEHYLTPLHAAAQQGHANIVRLLLERGAMVNPQRKNSLEQFFSTPLLAACYSKHYGIVQLLLDNAADFNAKLKAIPENTSSKSNLDVTHSLRIETKDFERLLMTGLILEQGSYTNSEVGKDGSLLGFRTLHFAVQDGETAIIKSLLKFGASLNFETKNGSTGIGLTIERDDQWLLALLLSAGANVLAEHKKKSIFNIKVLKTNVKIAEIIVKYVASSQPHSDDNNVTPLGIAVANELELCVEKLLQSGAGVHIEYNQEPLLHIAIKKKNYKIVKMLLEHGVDVNRCAKSGSSALLVAVENNESHMVELLLSAGADIKMSDLKFSSYGIYEPLKVAVINKNAEIVEMFLKKGLTDFDSALDSLFQLALKKSSPQVVYKFLYYRISINIQEESPIFYAIERNNLAVVRFLLKTDAFLNATTNDGETIVHFAFNSLRVSVELFQVLVDYGIDINAQNKENLSPLNIILNDKHNPLMMLVMGKKESLLKVLLSSGVNIDQVDLTEGKTMLELVIESENIKFLKLLLLHGADINFVNHNGETPLMIAINRGLKRSTEYEIKCGSVNNQISKKLDNLIYDQFLISRIPELKNFRILPYREVLRLLVQEFVRRQAAKEEVRNSDIRLIGVPYLGSYLERCRKEIELMKVKEICQGISYFHILVAKADVLATYVRSVQVKRVLLSESNVMSSFPEYGETLIERILIGRERRHLLDSSHHLLKTFFGINFPLTVVEYIFSFLTIKDLRSLHIVKEMCSN